MKLGLGLGFAAPAKSGNNPTFTSTWNTANTSTGSSTSTQVTLPLISAGVYDFEVDWGDGNNDTITAWDAAAKTHTYSSSGIYEIKINGTLRGFSFNNGGDRLKITDISNWGTLGLGPQSGHFLGCANLDITATDKPDLTGVTSLLRSFSACTSLTTPKLTGWDVSGVTTFRFMFLDSTNFNGTLGYWDVSNATTVESMFQSTSFNNPLPNWVFPASAAAFVRSTPFNQDVSTWDTSGVTSMNAMFLNATSFNQDVSGWNIEAVTNLDLIFGNCPLSVANYDALLIGWEAQNVNNNLNLNANISKYTGGGAAEAARTALINDHTWTFTDSGSV